MSDARYEIKHAADVGQKPVRSPGLFTRPEAVNEVDALLASGVDIIHIRRSIPDVTHPDDRVDVDYPEA